MGMLAKLQPIVTPWLKTGASSGLVRRCLSQKPQPAGSVGNGFVRASSDYGVNGTSDTITVIPGDIISVDVQPSVNIIVQSNTYQYSALGYDADSNLVGDLSASATWSTTDTSGNVDASGLYTAGTVPSPPVYYVKAEWSGLSDSGEVSVISNGVLSYVQIEY